MENNLEQDIEIQLQAELKRLKKAVEYIEQAKTQSQEVFDSTKAKFVEMSDLHETLKQAFQTSIADIENKFINQFSAIQQDIKKLNNNKTLTIEIENVKSELSKQQKIIEINVSNLNTKIASLTKQIRISKTFNCILLAFFIATLIIAIIK